MTLTKPIFIFAIAMITVSACKPKQPSASVLAFVKEFDGKSLTAAREILNNENERVDEFIHFMKSFKKETVKSFKPTEESFAAPFQQPSASELETKYAAFFAGEPGFKQQIAYPNSILGVDGAFRNNGDFSDISIPDFVTAKIFFRDGSTDDKKYLVDGAATIPSVKTIDSVLADASYSYPAKVVMLTLDKQHDKVTYKGATIRIEKLGDNRVRLVMEDKAFSEYLHIDALNKDGKPLDYTSKNNGVGNPEDMSRLLNDFNKKLTSLISQLDKGRFKDVAALQEEIKRQLPDGSPFDEEGRDGYVEGYFKGNIAKVNVYLADTRYEGKKQLMLKNIAPNYSGLFLSKDPKSNNYGFTDASGRFVIPATYKKLSQLNSYFFANEDYNGYYYYRLDTATRQLLKLDYEVRELTSQLAAATKSNATNSAGVMDGNGRWIVPSTYEGIYLDEHEQVLYANKPEEEGPLQGITTLYDYSGHQLSPESYYTNGNTYQDGLLLVEDKAHRRYFIDNKGKKAIDLKAYADASSFSNGLARVKNADYKYGFINTKGVLVIPVSYTGATPFNEGISMVNRSNNNVSEVALINTKNELVAPFRHAASTSQSGTGAKMEYTFDDKKYNARGAEVR